MNELQPLLHEYWLKRNNIVTSYDLQYFQSNQWLPVLSFLYINLLIFHLFICFFSFFFFANCSLTGCRFTFRLLRRQQAKRYLLFLNESVFSLFFLELFIKLKILPCVLNFNLKELIGPKNLFSFGAKKSPLRGELFSCKRVILPEGDTSQTQATFYLVENLRHTWKSFKKYNIWFTAPVF